MAIIYSYPLDLNPTTADLLLGTSIASGKPTKTFSIASLVALVNAQPTTGTVTNVATTNSTFIDVQGGPITGAGTITASLSAGGTPSNTTFLRGDNTWASASSTGSAQISILDEGVEITSDVDSINFTGSGVTTTTAGNNVTINIPSAAGGVTSIIGGTAINVSSATGNITVTNTGVTQLIAGTNITLSGTTGAVTISATNNPGTVESVIPGAGLQLDSGSLISNPTIGIDKNGSNNYILVGSVAAVPTVNDFLAFNQISSSNIKTTTFATIPITALPLVSTYIDSGDAGAVKNTTDSYTSTAKIINVVTLTSAEYASITPDVNTLYILQTSGGTSVLLTLSTTNSIISPDGTGTGTGYVLSGNLTGSTFTGIQGEPYSFTTIVTPSAGYYFSVAPGGMVASGTVPATPTSIVQTLTGVVQVIPTPAVIATLLIVTNIQGPGSDGAGFTLGGSLTGAIQTGIAPLTVNAFATTCVANTGAGYSFTAGPTIVNASSIINGSQTVVTTITGTLSL